MSFGNIGKVLAGQAIEAAKKNVIDSVVGPEPAKAEKVVTPAALPQPEAIGPVILGQLQAMQRPLGEDRELVVTYTAGPEMLRVMEVFVPSPNVFVLSCMDTGQNVTRVVLPAEAAVLVCKVIRVPAGVKPVRVNVLSPRKPDPS